MKVTAFIRKKARSKSDLVTKATIYFRVRDDYENVDIKAASELTINPNHWSHEKQGYKNRLALIREDQRIELENAINAIKSLIVKEYVPTVSNEWLKRLIFCYHHPNALNLHKTKADRTVKEWANRYCNEKLKDKHQQSNIRSFMRRLENYEYYLKKIKCVPNYVLNIDSITAEDLRDFEQFITNEHSYVSKFEALAKTRKGHKPNEQRSMNMVRSIMVYFRTIVNYYIHQGATTNNPFLQYTMPKSLQGVPIYMTIEERNKLYELDLTDSEDDLAEYRDMFVFQCMVGCRHYDLVHFTNSNIIDGVLEYIPHKTREKVGQLVRVPLGTKALKILESRKNIPMESELFPLHFNASYNAAIKKICKLANLNRMVTWLNPKTRVDERRPLYELVSSHMARRTFIGNLYNKVKDPALISSMSGHVDGSRAFSRYRTIDDDIKRELVQMID